MSGVQERYCIFGEHAILRFVAEFNAIPDKLEDYSMGIITLIVSSILISVEGRRGEQLLGRSKIPYEGRLNKLLMRISLPGCILELVHKNRKYIRRPYKLNGRMTDAARMRNDSGKAKRSFQSF